MVSKVELLRLVLGVAARASVSFGIGGGIAVYTWGYRRETADVDAFFHEHDRPAVLRALHELMPESYLLEQVAPSHYMVLPEGNAPDERLDLYFASADSPEELAIDTATARKYRGVEVPVFPADMLAACQYLANRGEVEDVLDVHTLIARGACTAEEVSARLRQMGLDEDADVRFPALLKYLAEVPRRKK